MKFYVVAAVILSLLFISEFAKAYAPAPVGVTMGQVRCVGLFEFPNKAMKYGDSSVDIIRLQNFLILQGFEIPAGATGYFGAQTKAAVSDFQIKYSFQILYPLKLTAPTGAVYSATRKQIDALYCNR